jgi:hypothetical protein
MPPEEHSGTASSRSTSSSGGEVQLVEDLEIVQEWEKRRRQYKDKMRLYNRLGLWVALPALPVTVLAPKDFRGIAFLVFVVAIVVFGIASSVLTEKYLRCPNCGLVPAYRGNALGTLSCVHCQVRLVEELMPPP